MTANMTDLLLAVEEALKGKTTQAAKEIPNILAQAHHVLPPPKKRAKMCGSYHTAFPVPCNQAAASSPPQKSGSLANAKRLKSNASDTVQQLLSSMGKQVGDPPVPGKREIL